MNQFVIHLILEYMGGAFKDHCQSMTKCCEFRFLVWAELLWFTGSKMNFLDKWPVGRISEFIMFANSCSFLVCFNRSGLRPIACYFFPYMCCYCWFLNFSMFNISKVFFHSSLQISFCISYLYIYIHIYMYIYVYLYGIQVFLRSLQVIW